METQVTLIRETASASELAARAISSVVNGEVDPITAYINISRMKKAIDIYKDNVDVRDITLRELSKYGKKYICICVSELREPDQYENTHCVFMRQSKEERERKDKRVYVGRGKSVVFRPAEPTPDQVADLPVAETVDDLPF